MTVIAHALPAILQIPIPETLLRTQSFEVRV